MAEAPFPIRQQAEQLGAVLPPLLVAAERVASTVAQGVHGRRRVGQGETFWQFRPYDMGDAPQSIDWRQSAKSDRVFVRQMEWEAAQSTWIWRDTSPSMDWRSTNDIPTKRDRADLLTLALTVLLIRGGEYVSLLGSGLRPSSGRSTLTRLALLVEEASHEGVGLPPVLPLPRYGQVVFIGDFLGPLDEIQDVARRYAETGVSGHLLQVLDPAEESLPYRGRVRMEGLEGEEPFLLSRVEGVRQDYHKRYEAQCEGVKAIARRLGWTYSHHKTDHPAEMALLGLYLTLSHTRGR